MSKVEKILDDGGIKLGGVVSDLNGLSARAMVVGLIEGKSISSLLDMARGRLKLRRDDLQAALDGDLTPRHRFILEHIHEHIATLEHSLAELDAYILAAMAPYQWAHRLLQTIPGIDQIASALILIEIGDDMTRFGSADRIAAWAALCPGNNESAGKRKSARIGKGNSVIRYIMCECANSAWKTKSSIASKYKNLIVRKTHKKAIIALAHKMIRLIFLLLTRKVAYHDPQIDYAAISAKKNAPRWIKQLKVIGQWPNNPSTSPTT
ncbi:transposase [Cupriavidus sp. D39]|uniref:transposase n=1 Tax=Cupriavidus sp. D39 TaxID=2997877 RepID=UPI00226DE70D|nr:transposase [Cupriavidus sp. D39]MCY0855055.1 transposase [Cupriavidus sp. D39]